MDNKPKPLSNIGCQDLLEMEHDHGGWLRYKVTLVNERFANLPGLGNMLKNAIHKVKSPWVKKYVVIHRGSIYIFNSDLARKPLTAFSLYQYHRILREDPELKEFKEYRLRPFKLLHVNSSARFFSASSEQELKKWMTSINRSMREVNSRPNSVRRAASVSSSNSTYSDVEESIYDTHELPSMSNAEVIEITNEDEEEADYLEYNEDQHDIEEEQEGLNQDLLSNLLRRKMMPLPLPPMESYMPMGLAPEPPADLKRQLTQRPLPSLPPNAVPRTRREDQDASSTEERRASRNFLPKPPAGAVPIMMPPTVGNKPKLPAKPKMFNQPPQEDDVTLATWDKSKDESKITLLETQTNGAFLIRESHTVADQRVLVVYVDGAIRQYKFQQNANGQLYINNSVVFDNPQQLLEHYKRNCLPNVNVCLAEPYTFYVNVV